MNSLMRSFLLIIGVAFLLASCDKAADLPFYNNGKAPVLSASATTVAPAPADSNNVALILNWTSPEYATDTNNYKFVVEIDSTGKNFAKPTTKVVMGKSSTSFLAKELNSMLLDRGYAFNVPVDMDVRIVSSYANNNERLTSNVIRIKMTPYKIPPKVAIPSSGKLFIVGNATQGGWSNPVPVPSQEFSRLDETTWAGIFQLNAGGSYLFLPVNGSWAAKYGFNGSNNSNNPNGDALKAEGGDMLAPANSGLYKIVVDFQQGKFTVTPYTDPFPTNLYIVGNATPGGWNNPVPTPSQQLTRINSSTWQVTLPLNGGGSYLLLPVNGDWGAKYGGVGSSNNSNNVTGDEFKFGGSDLLAPPTSGTYTITVNFAERTSTTGAGGRFTVQ